MKGVLKYKGGYVCDNDFDDEAAEEVCKEMGYKSSVGYMDGIEKHTSTEFSISQIVCSNDDCEYLVGPFMRIRECSRG